MDDLKALRVQRLRDIAVVVRAQGLVASAADIAEAADALEMLQRDLVAARTRRQAMFERARQLRRERDDIRYLSLERHEEIVRLTDQVIALANKRDELADALEAEMAHADQLAEALGPYVAEGRPTQAALAALAAHRARRARNETGETT